MLTNKEDIQHWLKDHYVSNYVINDDLTVDVKSIGVDLDSHQLESLPVQFGRVEGYFLCGNNKLKTLQGAPTYCSVMRCHNNFLSTLEYVPKTILSVLECSGNPIIEYRSVYKNISWVQTVILPSSPCPGFLYWLTIPGLQEISLPLNMFNELFIGIVQTNLHDGRNLLRCQEELIDAGLSKWAIL